MIPIDNKIVSRVGNILDKLDTLNKKIITKYFVLIRDKKYDSPIAIKFFSGDLTYIDFGKAFEKNQSNWQQTDAKKYYENMVQSTLPYYYKIINLYIHLSAILDTIEDINIAPRNIKKLLSNKYFTIQYNIFNSFDTPQSIAREQFNDKDWKTCELIDAHFQFIEAEIRRLMFIANDLHSEILVNKDLRIKPKSVTKDYDYMKEYANDKKLDLVIDADKLYDKNMWFNPTTSDWIDISSTYSSPEDLEVLKKHIITNIEESFHVPADKLPLKSDDIWSTIMPQAQTKMKTVEELKKEQLNKMQEEELNKMQEEELKKLYNMFRLKMMSQKQYYAEVNNVMNKYRQGNVIIPAT